MVGLWMPRGSVVSWFDGKLMTDVEARYGERERTDIENIFKAYKNAKQSAFEIRVNLSTLSGTRHRLMIRINNKDRLHMDIFDSDVCIFEDRIVQRLSDQYC